MDNEIKRGVQGRLAKLLDEHRALTSRRDNLGAELQTLTDSLRMYEENLLPELLREMGVTETKAEDGTSIKIKEILTANVAERNHAAADKILRRIGAGDIAQQEVKFKFLANEDHLLMRLLEFCDQQEIPSESKTAIHAATLKKVVSGALAEGKLNPEDLGPLGVFMVNKAVVKVPQPD